ncbi:MAG: 30S ribosomal protein S12 methylthiotransferase RimO [Oscillospiraceae bacterium]|nr:30S ribosomal protein S12 methylthiotransferase RimO [Oscillospiraceae bacterium]
MAVTVGIVSLGCAKNMLDAEHMAYNLREERFELQPDAALADVAVINTCGFIESAKQEAIETILEFVALKEEKRIKAIIVTGCLAERYREEILKELPEVDAVLGIGANELLGETIRKVLESNTGIEMYGDKYSLVIGGRRIVSTETYAYIKIAEGCSNHCTFCAIPGIRGKYRSRPMESIIDEAKWLAKVGYREIILIAQDTSRYGEDLYGTQKLAELLKELCKIDGLKWIRTLYCYPERITDELIDVVATEPKCVKYFDIPIQHCCDNVLKRMNRRSNEAEIRELVAKLRARIPNVIIRTTIMTGFPGETEEEFEKLCEFVKEMRFDRLGCFAYSQEEGTAAAKLDGQLDEDEKNRRAEIITQEQMLVSDQMTAEMLGKVYEVVVEGYDRYAECWFGRSQNEVPEIDGKIFFTSSIPLKVGDYQYVRITDTMDYDPIGEVILAT